MMSENKRNWFQKRISKLHLDFHNGPFVKIGEEFDAKKVVEKLINSGIETIVIFSKDHHGNCYYKTRFDNRHPGLKFDLFGEFVKEAKNKGMGVIAYHSSGWENHSAMNNPDWVQTSKDGRKLIPSESKDIINSYWGDNFSWSWMCINTPYVQELLWPQLEEIATNYEIDGFWIDPLTYAPDTCFCDYCLKEMSLRKIDIDNIKEVCKFKEASMFRYYRETYSFIKNINPELLVAYDNATYIGCSKDKDFSDYFSLEAVPWMWGYIHPSMFARYLRNSGRPFDLITNQFHRTWGDFGGFKHPNELKYEAATIIANGGLVSIGDQMPPSGKLVDAVYKSIKECNSFIKEREEYCIEATPIKSIAVLAKEEFPYSNMDVNFFFRQDKLSNLQGATKLLMEMHQQFDLIDEWMDIEKYKVLIIPEIMELDNTVVKKIQKFVENGGILIVSYLTSLEENNFALSHVLGVDFLNMSPYSISYAKFISEKIKEDLPEIEFACYDKLPYVKPKKNTEVFGYIVNPVTERSSTRYFSHAQAPQSRITNYPIATLNEYGKGKAIYLAMPIFSLYFNEDYYIYRLLIQSIFKQIYKNNVIKEVEAPISLEISLMEQKNKNRLILHLINYHSKKSTTKLPRIEEIYPVRDIKVKIRMNNSLIKSVRLIPDGKVEWDLNNNILKLKIFEINIHSLVVIEKG